MEKFSSTCMPSWKLFAHEKKADNKKKHKFLSTTTRRVSNIFPMPLPSKAVNYAAISMLFIVTLK